MTVRVNKPSFNIREKLSELGRKFGLKGSELAAAETVQEARDLVSADRKNLIINGKFDIWQRGTSTTGALSNAYGSADRWMFNTRSLTTRNISRQAFTNGQTDVPGNPIYYLRFEASNDSGGYGAYVMQRIEDVRVGAGEDVTVSFYAKVNSGGGTFDAAFSQQFGSGGSGAVDNTAGSFTPISSWKKFSFTTSLPSISGKTIGTNNYLRFDIRFPSNTAVTLDISQVQVERGRNVTEFEHRSYGEELSLCQRYYQSYGLETDRSGQGPFRIVWSSNGAASQALTGFMFPTPMRTYPTVTSYGSGTAGGNFRVYTGSTSALISGFSSITRSDRSMRLNYSLGVGAGDAAGWIDVGDATNHHAFTLDAEL